MVVLWAIDVCVWRMVHLCLIGICMELTFERSLKIDYTFFFWCGGGRQDKKSHECGSLCLFWMLFKHVLTCVRFLLGAF